MFAPVALNRLLGLSSLSYAAMRPLKAVLPLKIVATAVALVIPITSQALTLDQAATERFSFNFPNGDVDSSSYDGAGFDAFKPFASVAAPQVLSLSAFNGLPKGSNLEFVFLSQAAAYDGIASPDFVDRFGYKNDKGEFTTIFDSIPDGPGSVANLSLSSSDLITLALLSPEGLFSSVDSENHDMAAHILAMKVEKAGKVTVDPATLRGDPPFMFDLLPNDYILFIEDLAITGNLNILGIPDSGDFDYNDMVILIREREIPEPATLGLLSLGLLGGFAMKRRRQA